MEGHDPTHSLIRLLLRPVQAAPQPVAAVDQVLDQLVDKGAASYTPDEYLAAIRQTLANPADLAEVLQVPDRSGAAIRAYLRAIAGQLESGYLLDVREDCIFCRMIRGDIPMYLIEATDELVVFLSLENHPLVVPKKHVPNIYAMPDELAGAVMREARRIALAVARGLGCSGVYLSQANGRAAGQDVYHFHLHAYPHFDKNFPRGDWTDEADDTQKAATLAKLQQALADLDAAD